MKSFKIFTALIIIICMPLMFCGCAKNNSLADGGMHDVDEINTDTSVWLSYASFSGSKEYEITIEEPRILSVKTITRGGALKLKVDFGEKSLYDGDITDKADGFTVALDTAGDYKITLTGDKHDGEVNLSWMK